MCGDDVAPLHQTQVLMLTSVRAGSLQNFLFRKTHIQLLILLGLSASNRKLQTATFSIPRFGSQGFPTVLLSMKRNWPKKRWKWPQITFLGILGAFSSHAWRWVLFCFSTIFPIFGSRPIFHSTPGRFLQGSCFQIPIMVDHFSPWWASRPRKAIFSPRPPNSPQTPSRPPPPPLSWRPPPLVGLKKKKRHTPPPSLSTRIPPPLPRAEK